MCRFFKLLLAVVALMVGSAQGATFTLNDGKEYSGEPISIKDEGVMFKTSAGTYSPRVSWDKFTQDALKALLAEAKTAQDKALIEPLIDEPAKKVSPKLKEITVKPVSMPPRPKEHIGLTAMFSSPLGLLVFLAVYAATIFAGYEVAIYRDQPIGLVCGIAAVPFVGILSPVAFLLMKPSTLPPPDLGPAPEMARSQVTTELAGTATAPTSQTGPMTSDLAPVTPIAPAPVSAVGSAPVTAVGGAQVSRATQPQSNVPAPIVFRKGDFSFNRRFFETKLANFQKLVPSQADKDMVLWIKAVRGEYTGRRVTQISPTELHLQVFKADATADEAIPFVEILEVQIRHKDFVG